MSKNALLQLQEFGQSIWLDFLPRGLIASAELYQLIEGDDLRRVTANRRSSRKRSPGVMITTTRSALVQQSQAVREI